MRNEETKKRNIESLISDVDEAVRRINSLSHQPELGLDYSFDFGVKSFVLKVDSVLHLKGKHQGNPERILNYEEDMISQREEAYNNYFELNSIVQEAFETAKQGEDYQALTGLIGQLSVKAYRGQIEFDCAIDVKTLLADIEFMKELTDEFYIAHDNDSEWDKVNTFISGLSDKYNSRKMKLPDTYKGKMKMKTIASMMFEGEVPHAEVQDVSESEESKQERESSLLDRVQTGFARIILAYAYKNIPIERTTEYFDHEDAADATLNALTSIEQDYNPLKLTGVITDYIDTIAFVPRKKWEDFSLDFSGIYLTINKIIENTKESSFGDMKQQIVDENELNRSYFKLNPRVSYAHVINRVCDKHK